MLTLFHLTFLLIYSTEVLTKSKNQRKSKIVEQKCVNSLQRGREKGVSGAAGECCGRLIWGRLEGLPRNYFQSQNGDRWGSSPGHGICFRNFKIGFFRSTTFKWCANVKKKIKKKKTHTAAVSVAVGIYWCLTDRKICKHFKVFFINIWVNECFTVFDSKMFPKAFVLTCSVV